MKVAFIFCKSAKDYERGNGTQRSWVWKLKGTDSLSCHITSWPNGMKAAFPCHCRIVSHSDEESNGCKIIPPWWSQHEKAPLGLRLCLPQAQRVKYQLKPLLFTSREVCKQLHTMSFLVAAWRGLKRKPHYAFPITQWEAHQLVFETTNCWPTVQTGITLKWVEKSFNIMNEKKAIAWGMKVFKMNRNYSVLLAYSRLNMCKGPCTPWNLKNPATSGWD